MGMYAIVKTGGKQYKVSPGDTILVEKLEGASGSKVEFNDVLMVADESTNSLQIGKPLLANIKVSGEIVEQTKGDKVIIFKYKRRKGYRKKTGHRQPFTRVKIKEIVA
jgi:large subunit ribosomal protein L21